MERRNQAPEKIRVSQGQSTRRTDYSRRMASLCDAKSHRQQDKPASSSNEDSKLKREQQAQTRTASSNEDKIKPRAYGASKSDDSSLQVLQPTWRRDSVVSNSSHEKKSPISLQHRQPIPYSYSSKSHLVSVRSLDAGRRQKKIAGGGGPGEESSSLKQPLLGSSSEQQESTKQDESTKQQTYDKEGKEAYNNAYQAIEDRYRQKAITFEEFDKATDDLKAAFIQNKNS